MSEPLVIFGGYLSFPLVYRGMGRILGRSSMQPVSIVRAWTHEWLLLGSPGGWSRLLNKLDRAVRQAARESQTGKITLIGHSAGGVLSRFYTSPAPPQHRASQTPSPSATVARQDYAGAASVSRLITLGSPHNLGPDRRLQKRLLAPQPDTFPAPEICSFSVAGKAVYGNPQGSLRERWVYRQYKRICSDGNTWGDGLVPLQSQLLAGSQQIILEGVSHFTGFGGPWYGDKKVLPLWWNACMNVDERGNQDSITLSLKRDQVGHR